MSDMPWAVAWLGKSQCVWTTMNAHSDLLDIHDYQKPIRAIYLSRRMLDAGFLSHWVLSGNPVGFSVLQAGGASSPGPEPFPRMINI